MSALFSDGDQTNTNKKSNRQLQPLLLKKSTNENNSKFAKFRDDLEKKMSPQQVADAQKRTKQLRALIDANIKNTKWGDAIRCLAAYTQLVLPSPRFDCINGLLWIEPIKIFAGRTDATMPEWYLDMLQPNPFI